MPIEVASGPNFGYDHPHARHFTYIPRTDQLHYVLPRYLYFVTYVRI